MNRIDQRNRRTLLQAGLAAVAGAATGRLFAQSADQPNPTTPAQSEGPFYPIHQQADRDWDMTQLPGHPQRAEGEVIDLEGQVLDEDHRPVANALVDIWQANARGRYQHEKDPNPAPLDPHFQGWAQIHTDDQGRYRVKTIIPGAYPVNNRWMRPPHLHFKVSRRGYHELITQMYFAGHPLNAKDRLLREVAESERAKLIVAFTAMPADDAAGAQHGRFDIVLRRVG